MKIQNMSFLLSLIVLSACGEVEEATVKEVESLSLQAGSQARQRGNL